jgi:uncharacterized membrane protein YjgN (DUF898 family)
MADYEPQGEPGDAFEFVGTWREYLPIALTNLALTIVSLGFYRFWAKARERRYLWSRTRFIDDKLEWTGTGKEMFIGFLVATAILLPAILFLNFGFQAMLMRGQAALAGLIFAIIYFGLLYLFGIARFRSLRYRLTRSWWHGIRGGSDNPGFKYGWSSMWKPIAGAIPLGLLIPRSMVSLWNERWNAMSFGPDEFRSEARHGPLMKRWILLLVSPLLLVMVGFIGAMVVGVSFNPAEPASAAGAAVAVLVFVIGFYALIALIGIGYYAAYFRECIGALRLGKLDFQFEARSKDWLLLFLGDVALVIGTLGIGICFLGYRHWSFFIRHMGATGEVDPAAMVQSETRAPRGAEGLADAFDIGAI